jgi:hypothetical protein
LKLASEVSKTEISGTNSKPQDFRILASKTAFSILSSGLYNDKITAIIRELSSNAYDSHVAAGKKEVPFEIHLPNNFEPYFTVRDFGIGLSDADVKELYCTYFASAKSNSNLFIGALGLGSKSPFCYTEGFTVISRFEGKARTYTAFIGEEGTPNILGPLSKEDIPEDEKGLEISFPVKITDCEEFRDKTAKILEFFDPKPNTNMPVVYEKTDYILTGKDWGIRKVEFSYAIDNTRTRAVQGMVPYVVGNLNNSKVTETHKSLLQMELDLFFDIGDLSVAASREALSNDEATVTNILRLLDRVNEEIIQKVKEELLKAKTPWEARLKIHELSQIGHLKGIVNDAFNRGAFDGIYQVVLSKEAPFINQYEFLDVTIKRYRRRMNSDKCYVANEFEVDYEHRKEIAAKIKAGEQCYSSKVPFTVHPGTRFVVGDVDFGGERYLQYYVNQSRDLEDVYYITKSHKSVTTKEVEINALQILHTLGNPPSILLSTLKEQYKTVVKEIEKKPQVIRNLLYFDPASDYQRASDGGYIKAGWRNAWKTADSKNLPKTPKYYVPLKRLKPTTVRYDYADSFWGFVTAVREANLIPFEPGEQIYGIPESSDILKNSGEWIEFSEAVFTTLKKQMTPEYELKLLIVKEGFRTQLDELSNKLIKELDDNSPLRVFMKELAEVRKISKRKANAMLEVIHSASYHNKYTMASITPFAQRWKRLEERYPLLLCIDYNNATDHRSDHKISRAIIDYIKLIDQKIELEEQGVIELQQELILSDHSTEEEQYVN